jgi:hypothetical protein
MLLLHMRWCGNSGREAWRNIIIVDIHTSVLHVNISILLLLCESQHA